MDLMLAVLSLTGYVQILVSTCIIVMTFFQTMVWVLEPSGKLYLDCLTRNEDTLKRLQSTK